VISLQNHSNFIFLINLGALFCIHFICHLFETSAAQKSNNHHTVKTINLLFFILDRFFVVRNSCIGFSGVDLATNNISIVS